MINKNIKNYLLLLLVLFSIDSVIAQCSPSAPACGLIFNGDFEQNNGIIPTGLSQMTNSCGWLNSGGTPDYYHTAATIGSQVQIPTAFHGSQAVNPVFGGNAYAGTGTIRLNNVPNNYEILGTTLVTPLAANTNYTLTFNISRAESTSNNAIQYQAYIGNTITMSPTIPGNINLEPNGILKTNTAYTTNTIGWDTITFNFNSGVGGQTRLFLGGLYNVVYQTAAATQRAYYFIDNVNLAKTQSFNPILNIPNAPMCANAPAFNLAPYLTNGVTGGVFSGPGVVNTGGVYTFNPAIAGAGTHTITYTIPNPTACPEVRVTDTVIVNSCLPATPPYISQVYSFSTNDKFIEVKNADGTMAIAAGMYYLAYYENGASTSSAPTGFVDLGAIPVKTAKVFKGSGATNPSYAASTATLFPNFVNFDGNNDIVIITTSTGTNAYNDRIDLAGNATNWCSNTSLVRMSCGMSAPRNVYDAQDWVSFTNTETSYASAKTNAVLGRHFSDPLSWSLGVWNDVSPDVSNPDRSRQVSLEESYTTGINGSFEACSLSLELGSVLTISASTYVSVQTAVTLDSNLEKITVLDKGSLVMVRDSHYGLAGANLVNLGTNATIEVNRKTTGINSNTDYVYWSSPLSALSTNSTANQVFNFGTGTGQINPNRFYLFENANFYDGINAYGDNGTGTDGYDDDSNVYVPFSTLTASQSQQLIPGRGYATWPALNTPTVDYAVKFIGKVNNGVVTVPVYRNDSAPGLNPNLVGNPYPSAIDLNILFQENASLIEPVAYIWGRSIDTAATTNPGPDGYNYNQDNFLLYNPTMIIDPTFSGNLEFNGNLPVNERGTLASCQSFFVRTLTNQTILPEANTGTIQLAGNLVFNNKMRTTLPNTTFTKTSNTVKEEGDKLWVNLTDGNNYSVQLGIAFLENGSSNYQANQDIKAIQGRKYNFYTQSTVEDLIIDVQDQFSTNKVIPLGILNVGDDVNQELKISIPKKSGVFETQTVFLEDTLLGITHNLSNSSYTFKADSKIIEGRFNLRFTTNSSPVIASKKTNDQVEIRIINNEVTVKSANKNIQNVIISDIYTPATSGLVVVKTEKVNGKEFKTTVLEKYRLLNIKVVLEDGSIFSKKILR